MPNVSMTAPFNPYTVDQQAIERQRQLAQLMQQQSMQPLQGPVASGPLGNVNVPMSWTQGLAKMLQAYAGSKGQQTANEQEKALGQRYMSDLSSTLQRAMQAGSGTPASTEIMPMDEQANGGLGAANQQINIPGQAPNRELMASILMQHPGTAPLGQQQLMMQMQRQMFMDALSGGPTTPSQAMGNQPMGSGPTPQAQIGRPTQLGGPAGGVPMAVWLQGDPTGKSYMEQLAKDNAPISTRYGIFKKGPTGAFNAVGGALPSGAMPYDIGPNGEQRIAPLPGQIDTQRAIEGVKQGFDVVNVPHAGGETVPTFKSQLAGFPSGPQASGVATPPALPSTSAPQPPATGDWSDMPMRSVPTGVGQSTFNKTMAEHEATAAAELSQKYGTKAEEANQRLAFNNQALDLVDKSDTGTYAAQIAGVKNFLTSRLGIPESDFSNTPSATISLTKDLVNAATQRAKQQFGSRITQSEVMLMLNRAAPNADMPKQAIKFLLQSDNAQLAYQLGQANDLGKYLERGGDPYRFEAWYSSKFPMTKAVEAVPPLGSNAPTQQPGAQPARVRKYNPATGKIE